MSMLLSVIELSLWLCLAGCQPDTPPEVPVPHEGFDTGLVLLATQYLTDASSYGLSANTEVVTMRYSAAGVSRCAPPVPLVDEFLVGCCVTETTPSGRRLGAVYILPGLDPVEGRAVAYHEFSHCFFASDHSDDEANLMYPTLPTPILTGDEDWTTTLRNLFTEVRRQYGSR